MLNMRKLTKTKDKKRVSKAARGQDIKFSKWESFFTKTLGG